MKEFKLNNGVLMPSIGIGTYLLEPAEAYNSVLNALKLGYKMIDTANAYRNEVAVGKAIKDSKLNREDVFVSTKLWPSEYDNPNAVKETLSRLKLDYIDLLFLHQPTSNWENGYKLLLDAYKKGLIRAIGVSNFEDQISDLLSKYDIHPQVIQVECHPFFPQTKLRKITEKENIHLMSWFPLGGKGTTKELLESDIISSIAKKYHKSPAQIVLKWHNEMGFIVIPGSKNVEHIKDNLNIFDFSLTKDDMDNIAKLNTNSKRYVASKDSLEAFLNWKIDYEKE